MSSTPEATPHDVPEKILSLVAAIKRIPREKVRLDSSFEELGIDSLDGINLIFEVEGAFDVSIPDEQARSIRNVQQMVDGVKVLLAAAGRS
jgi:acyl carrier protein